MYRIKIWGHGITLMGSIGRALALLPILLPSVVSHAAGVGTLSGQFSVTPEGSASYRVPIKVPPGIGGMQPELSLVYSSQSGNGLLGMGWNLGGMSAVMRCGKSLAQEGVVDGVDLTSDDKFCLDGVKLISTNGVYGQSGTTYTTEIDSYTKIVQDEVTAGCDGPCGFTVYTKAGQIYEYGYDSKAIQNIAGKTAALSWSVHKLKDTLDNTITYSWFEDTAKGSHRIDKIRYTTNVKAGLNVPLAEIQFYYKDRPDKLEGYALGSRVTTDKLLEKITVRRGAGNKTKIREYRLGYITHGPRFQSLLQSLTECGFNTGGVSSCLKPTILGWKNPSKFYNNWVKVGSGLGFTLSRCKAIRTGDVDGDGKTDSICVYESDKSGSSRSITYVKSSKTGYSQWKDWYNEGGKSTSNPFDARTCSPVNVADINGDGLSDLVCAQQTKKEDLSTGEYTYTDKTYIQLSTGTSFLPWATWSSQTNVDRRSCNARVGDVDGDGRHDLICIDYTGTFAQFAENGKMSPWQKIGSAHSKLSKCRYITTGDVNGDGLTDNICLYDTTTSGSGSERTDVQISLGNHYDSWRQSYGNTSNYDLEYCEAFHEGDFNGDGQTDMLCAYTGNHYFVQLSKGGYGTTVGFEGWQSWGTDGTLSQKNCRDGLKAIDVDIDGRTDLVCAHRDSASTTTTYVKFSTGSGFTSWEKRNTNEYSPITDINSCHKVLAGDTNGDGHADLICIKSEGGVVNTYVQKHTDSAPSYLLGTITDAFNNKTQIEYRPLTDPAVYQKYTNGAYPAPDFQAPIYVVYKASASDGVGGMSGSRYQYKGAKIDRRGRGFLGFNKVITINDATGIKSITRYSQTFPTIGMPELAETFLPNGTRIGYQKNNWYVAKPGNGRYRVLSTRSEEKSYQLTGAQIKTVITLNQQYDSYGNPKKVTVTTNGGGQTFTQITQSEFNNDSTTWHLGRLTKSTITSKKGADSKTRVSAFEYDSVTGLLVKEIIEPNNPQFTLIKSYGHDDFGNRTSETVEDSGSATYKIASATTTASFNYGDLSNGKYTVTTTNALNHNEIKIVDARYGQPFSLKGPNKLTTTWTYDHFGRQIQEKRADNTKTRATYIACSANAGCKGLEKYRLETIVYDKNNTLPMKVNTYFDGLARDLRKESYSLFGDAIFSKSEYDNRGRLLRQSRPYIDNNSPNIHWTDFDYDVLDRPTFIYSPDGGVLQTEYKGLQTVITKFPDSSVPSNLRYWQRIKQTVNALGQEVLVVDENGQQLKKGYDALGNLLYTKDPNNNKTTLGYDIRGHKVSMDDPDMGFWQYKYDALGQLRWQKDAKAQVTTMTYDTLGRMKTRKEAEGTTTWAYDTQPKGTGKLASISAPNGYFEQPYYDWLGRVNKTLTQQAGSGDLWVYTNYDSHGRVLKTTYPTGYAVQNTYSAFGHLFKVKEVGTNKTLWKAKEMDADGNVTLSQLGGTDALISARLYDPASGRMKAISTGSQGKIQSLHYTFDPLGNLKQRIDDNQNALTEKFGYDELNRLTSAQLVGFGSKAYNYDHLGNILQKGAVADYKYERTDNAGPHAVTKAYGKRYRYDKNGSMVSGNDRNIQWTSYNKPQRITKGSTVLNFKYGPSRARTQQTKTVNGKYTSIVYLGKLFERSSSGGETKNKHFIYAGGSLISIHTTSNKAAVSKRYIFTDHLGSMDVITRDDSTIVGRLSFNAFGGQRGLNWRDSNTLSQLQVVAKAVTSRGFTGHEQLDDVGLIHMNGRVYDPGLGRFISADPQVQFASNLQSYNRYSYVHNNPLSYTDPSGFGLGSWVKNATGKLRDAVYKWTGQKAAVNFIKDNRYAQMAVQIAAVYFGGPIGAALASAALTRLNGGDFGDMVRAGIIGGIGGAIGGMDFGIGQVLASGAFGGITTAMSGGDFVAGFAIAGFTAGIAPGLKGLKSQAMAFTVSTIVAGTASVIGGGKFANGAKSAAFGYMVGAALRGGGRLREWHYARNAENDQFLKDEGLYGRNDITRDEINEAGEFGMKKASPSETILHQNGVGNENNMKFTSRVAKPESWFQENISNRYGRHELIVRPNNNGAYTHVNDSINMGTLNHGNNPATHIPLDVVPFLMFGNRPGNDN